MVVLQCFLLIAMYYAFIWAMENLSSSEWIDAYSWVWILSMIFFYATWYSCR
jgi:hypothetical protein